MKDSRRSVDRLQEAERTRTAQLFTRWPYAMQHLDWTSLQGLIQSPDLRAWVLRSGEEIEGILGATVQINAVAGLPPAAWLRAAMLAGFEPDSAQLDLLWEPLLGELLRLGVQELGCLALYQWMQAPLERWGFRPRTRVVTLRRRADPPAAPSLGSFRIREAREADFADVARVDGRAFEPLWHYNADVIRMASLYASYFAVLEREGEMLGYQLTTYHDSGVHLARLAVVPELQGQGCGRMLVQEMLHHFAAEHVSVATVNTQEDNLSSQRVYTKLGFQHIDEGLPVWTLKLQ